MPPRLTLAYRLQGGIGRIGGIGGIGEEACGLEMWNGVRHMFRLLAGGADLANRRERRGLAKRLPHSQREIFMRVKYLGVEGMLFS